MIMARFSSITRATSQLRATQVGSSLGHLKGVTIDQAIQMCHTRRLLPFRSRPMHPFLSINKGYFGLLKDNNRAFFLFLIAPVWISLPSQALNHP